MRNIPSNLGEYWSTGKCHPGTQRMPAVPGIKENVEQLLTVQRQFYLNAHNSEAEGDKNLSEKPNSWRTSL